MAKSTSQYWSTIRDNADWAWVAGLENQVEELTLAMDERTGHYTRLTRFLPGADTSDFGAKSHAYPEEVYIISGSLYDGAFKRVLQTGDYASRPPGEWHGPFRTDDGCLVLEVSYPTRDHETSTLEGVRSAIERIDGHLVELLSQRAQCVAAAGRLKLDVTEAPAPDRVEEVIRNVTALARAHGAPEKVVETTYRAMLASFIDYERQIHQRLDIDET